MNLLAFFLLLVLAAAWIILPLVPALREFFRPTDVEPLTMVGRDNADITRFARNFRDYLQGQLTALEGSPDARGEQTGKLPDNTPFMRLSRLPNEISRTTMPPGATGRLLVLDQSTVLDGGEQFRLEVWSREDFIGGPSATYRAILGEQNVELAERSVILRWVHSVGPLVVGPGSSLYGRTSSDKAVHLAGGVTFDRIGAPLIVAGEAAPRPEPAPAAGKMFQAPERSRVLGDHLRVEQDLIVPADTTIEGNIVVAGRCWLGQGRPGERKPQGPPGADPRGGRGRHRSDGLPRPDQSRGGRVDPGADHFGGAPGDRDRNHYRDPGPTHDHFGTDDHLGVGYGHQRPSHGGRGRANDIITTLS